MSVAYFGFISYSVNPLSNSPKIGLVLVTRRTFASQGSILLATYLYFFRLSRFIASRPYALKSIRTRKLTLCFTYLLRAYKSFDQHHHHQALLALGLPLLYRQRALGDDPFDIRSPKLDLSVHSQFQGKNKPIP